MLSSSSPLHPAPDPQTPPFCPNPQCSFHLPRPDWRFKKAGFFSRKSDHARIQRFRCLHCGRFFSSPSFAPTYWLQRRDLLLLIAQLSLSGAGLRQMARTLACAPETVARQLARAARHALLFHSQLLLHQPLSESVAVDGFESFEFSHFFPCHFHLAVGRHSWFLHHFTDSPLRRKGRMTRKQRLRRDQLEAQLGRPDPQAVEKDMAQLVGHLLDRLSPGETLDLHSDEHPAYPRALRRLGCAAQDRLRHFTISSRAARTPQNPLFVLNSTDAFLRHSQANHRRETMAASKRRQGAAERLVIFQVWRNCIKRRWENGPRKSAAMVLGLTDHLMSWREVFRQRLFPGHTRLPERWWEYYGRRVKTAVFGERQREHRLKYAF